MSSLDDLSALVNRLPFLGTIQSDLAQLRRMLYDRRAPRVMTIGAAGSGRTTLANELLLAAALPERPSAVAPEGQWVRIRAAGRSLDWLELDTTPLEAERAARFDDALGEAVPDVVLLTLRAEGTDAEVAALAALAKSVAARIEAKKGKATTLGVLLQADALGLPIDTARVDRETHAMRTRLGELGVELARPVPVALPSDAAAHWNLAELGDAIFTRLPDAAQVEGARALPVSSERKEELARLVVQRCAFVAVTVGLAPVPFADAFLLIPLQGLMVTAVAYIGGQPWDARAGAEWLGSVGILGGAAFGLRWLGQQAVKAFPGAGTLLAASIAGSGTMGMGLSAIAYFIEGPGHRRPRALLPADAPPAA